METPWKQAGGGIKIGGGTISEGFKSGGINGEN